MSVLIDTSVWSLSLRRLRRDLNPKERAIVFRCRDLTVAGEAIVIGPICQETLSGIAEREAFERVRERLALIDELPVTMETFILGAEFYNVCRGRGIVPEAMDMTICAAAYLSDTAIFTTDPDFPRYARHLPIALHVV